MAYMPSQIITEIILLVRAVARAAGPPVLPRLTAFDLTMAQLKLLLVLAGAQRATVSELAGRLNISAPTASHLVDKLVQVGLAQRTEDPHDRRRTIVTLTEQGEELHNQLRAWTPAEQLRVWLEQLAPAELQALAIGLRALARAAGVDATQACCDQGERTPLAIEQGMQAPIS